MRKYEYTVKIEHDGDDLGIEDMPTMVALIAATLNSVVAQRGEGNPVEMYTRFQVIGPDDAEVHVNLDPKDFGSAS